MAACRPGRGVRVRRLVGRPCRARCGRARSARPRGPGERHGRHPELRLVRALDRPSRRAGPGHLHRRRLTGAREAAPSAALRDVRRGMGGGARRPARRAPGDPAVPPRHRRTRLPVGIRAGHDGGGGARSQRASRRAAGAVGPPAAGGRRRRPLGPATVSLVGAGPGDPKLITVRGAEVLGRADVVVYDRLASPALLDLAPPTAERIYVGKEPGRSAMPQDEIDALLVERALDGQTVVRLKGGDPFVFGRGGEELLACIEAGVACEVVPGITSADRRAGAGRDPRHASGRRAELRGRHGEHRPRRRGRPRAGRHVDGHARRADGGRQARRDLRRTDRGGATAHRARRDRPVGGHTGATHDRGNARRPADAGRGGADRSARHADRRGRRHVDAGSPRRPATAGGGGITSRSSSAWASLKSSSPGSGEPKKTRTSTSRPPANLTRVNCETFGRTCPSQPIPPSASANWSGSAA